MKTFKKIMLISIILLLTMSCKKDDLPKATQEGKNIMAAKVNGEIWVKTACFGCIGAGGGINAEYTSGFLNLRGEQFKSKTNDSVIGILIRGVKLGQNEIDGINSTLEYNDYGNDRYYKTSSTSVGNVIITKIDVSKKIISGTFSFTAENEENPNDIITVTDGRFDVTYN